MTRRLENEEFFPAPSPLPPWVRARLGFSVPEADFYATPPPPSEPGFLVRAAARPAPFGALLFAVGWAGILLQLGFFRQLVIGAPLFEEFAKLGPPLVLVALLRSRNVWARLPWAWASGAAFGIFEHYSTYPDESLVMLAERIAFHAGATGLSMALFTAVEALPDVRTRWVATLPASVIHWGNNFFALVFALLSVFLPFVEQVAIVWTFAMTTLTFVLTVAIVGDPEASRRRFGGLASVLLPRIAEPQSLAAPTAPEAPSPMARAPPSTSDAPAAAEAPGAGPPEAPR